MDEDLAYLIQDVRRRTASYAFLARALSSERALEGLVTGLRDNPPKTGTDLDTFSAKLLMLSEQADDDTAIAQATATVNADHDATFRAAGDGRDGVSPLESDNVDLTATPFWHDAASLRGAVESTYEAEGFDRANAHRYVPQDDTPLDHICMELSFMTFLGNRAAASLEGILANGAGTGTEDEIRRLSDAEIALNTQFGFVEDHLLPWVPAFCDELEGAAGTAFYRGVAQMLRRLIESEASYLDELGGRRSA